MKDNSQTEVTNLSQKINIGGAVKTGVIISYLR